MRQILAVALGIVLSFAAVPVSGYLLYRFSDSLPNQGPVLARYIINPVVALLVGACVGSLAKSRAGTLAVLSLVPWALTLTWFGRHDQAHLTTLIILGFLYLLAGMSAGMAIFRIRTRTTVSALATK